MRHGSLFAAVEQQCPDAAPRNSGVDEKGADLRVDCGIELGGDRGRCVRRCRTGSAAGSIAAAREPAAGFDDEVGAVAGSICVSCAECTRSAPSTCRRV
jgi:hypothetical protein